MGTRILAGKARGKKIKTRPGFSTRPLLGRVKESLFGILGQKIKNACFLDLYAGTGNVGLEALSRGAKSCWFVEKDFHCARIIKENLARLGMTNSARTVRADVLKFLPRLEKEFDLIFVGPPYQQNLILPALEVIGGKRILTKKGWVICQHHRQEELSENVGQLGRFRQKLYGDIALSFYKYLTTEDTESTEG